MNLERREPAGKGTACPATELPADLVRGIGAGAFLQVAAKLEEKLDVLIGILWRRRRIAAKTPQC